MTVRASQLVLHPDSTESWAYDLVRHDSKAYDMLAAHKSSDVASWMVLPMVRGIMRERGDCNRIPRVIGLVMMPQNLSGHDLEIEVEYSTHGYRAIYGASLTAPSNVSCYMD